MFSEKYNDLDMEVRSILNGLEAPTRGKISELLAQSKVRKLELHEIAQLLQIGKMAGPNAELDMVRNFILIQNSTGLRPVV